MVRVWRLSDIYLSDVCLSVTHIGPNSTTERPMKTKIGTGSPRHTWLGHHFQGQKVKGQLAGGVAYCGGLIVVAQLVHYALSSGGAVYCNRSCLWVCDSGRAVSEPYYSQCARSVCISLSTFFILQCSVVAESWCVVAGRSLSSLSSSQIIMNPDITEAHRLRGWYDSEGTSASYKEYKRDGDTSSIGAGLTPSHCLILALSSRWTWVSWFSVFPFVLKGPKKCWDSSFLKLFCRPQ